MKKIILLAVALYSVFFTLAQKPEMKKIQVGDFYIYSGVHNGGFGITFDDLKKLAPESDLLNSNLAGYNNGDSYDFSSGNFLSVKLGLNFLNKEHNGYKKNPQLQIGFTYQTHNSAEFRTWKNEAFRTDTLTSATSPNIVYIDSVFDSNISADYRSDNFLIDLALVYCTDSDNRWSFFGGFGIAAGVSINAYTSISEYNSKSIRFSLPGHPNEIYFSDFSPSDITTEKFENDMNILALAHLPLGISFKVAKSTKFWKDLNLFYEVTPMMKYLSIPEAGGFVNVGVKHGIGLKLNVR
jgi:hypothetical protein